MYFSEHPPGSQLSPERTSAKAILTSKMGVWPSILTNEAGQGVISDPGIRVCTFLNILLAANRVTGIYCIVPKNIIKLILSW